MSEESRFTGECNGTSKCKCRKCCGDRKVVKLPKALLSYDRRCLKFCRPGITDTGVVEIRGTDIGPGERDIAASDLIDPNCTNSLVHAQINAEYEMDLRCAAHTITRDILVINDTIPVPGLWQQYSEKLLCKGRAEVEIDAEATITAESALADTTINAKFINLLTNINEGALPLVVSAIPTLSGTATVEVNVAVTITP